MKVVLCILLLGLSSCFLIKDFKKDTFVYNSNEQLPLLIPKGYTKENIQVDSVGNRIQFFNYGNGTAFYVAQLTDSATVQYIDSSLNIPQMYPQKVWLYKGIDSSGLYWRESQYKNFRFGYKKVPSGLEVMFDSAVNYASFGIIKKSE